MPLRRLPEHCRGRSPCDGKRRKGTQMNTFRYTRAQTAQQVVAAAAEPPHRAFLAGAPTLIVLMKLEVEPRPEAIALNALPLNRLEAIPDVGVGIGALAPAS